MVWRRVKEPTTLSLSWSTEAYLILNAVILWTFVRANKTLNKPITNIILYLHIWFIRSKKVGQRLQSQTHTILAPCMKDKLNINELNIKSIYKKYTNSIEMIQWRKEPWAPLSLSLTGRYLYDRVLTCLRPAESHRKNI